LARHGGGLPWQKILGVIDRVRKAGWRGNEGSKFPVKFGPYIAIQPTLHDEEQGPVGGRASVKKGGKPKNAGGSFRPSTVTRSTIDVLPTGLPEGIEGFVEAYRDEFAKDYRYDSSIRPALRRLQG